MPNKLVSSFASISRENSHPTPLAFSDWGKGQIFSWYKGLDHRAKSINKLQIWKDISGAVPHRFIVLHMSDNHIHRFDRRPDRESDNGTNTMELLTNQAVTSQDTYMLDIDLSRVEKCSLCEIELILSGRVDLMAVISACYAISNDESTRDYTFLKHNCFFFSWAILMVVSRHHLPYEVPSHDSVIHRFQSQIGRLTYFIVEEAIALFLDLFTQVVTIFRKKADTPVYQGLHIIGKAAWHLPDGYLRFVLRQLFIARLHFGLRDQLNERVKTKLETIASPLYRAILSKHMSRDTLDAHLWIEGTKNTVREGFEQEIRNVLWESILEVISSGLGNIEAEQLSAQLSEPLKFSVFGRNVAQFCAVWNGALHGGLQAAKTVGENISGLSDNDAFERTWFAVRDGAFGGAQTVVESTRAQINKPQRDRMWTSVWTIWNESWEEAHRTAQPRAIQALKKIVEEVLDTAVGIVIKDMRESRVKTIQACVSKEHKWLGTHRKAVEMTNATLQEYMQDIMKKGTWNAEVLQTVHSSIARIWEKARQHLSAPAAPRAPLETVAEHD